MNSKEALQNIGIEFDNMGMICTNIGYEDFYSKDLHFNEIFKTEIDIIKQDLDRLEKLEQAFKIIIDKKVSSTMLWNSADEFDYNLYQRDIYQLTEQEYELLKEVLK